ncbi:MAG: flagellar filament capping protein FliD [Candidatus Eisenbacteria bacterium]|nr:flagellar filament capping protein FliD [Candidatus Eisenbacteria bacterium]
MSTSSVSTIRTAELQQFLEVYMADSNSRLSTLTGQRDSLQVKLAVYNDLRTKLSTLRGLAEDMAGTGSLSAFGAKTTTLSSEGVLRVSAGAGAMSLAHSIHVDQLAHAHTVVSDRFDKEGTSLSTTWAGTQTFAISVDGENHAVSVDIEAGSTNEEVLTAVANAINTITDDPVGASKMADTPSTAKLTIASAETGAEYKMTFTDTDGLLAALGINPAVEATDTTGGFIYADEELDALFVLDGINITHSSNTVEDVLAGVTIELLGAQDAEDGDVTMTIATDTEAVKATVQEFISAYNEAYSFLKSKISIDTTTYTRGVLAGDYPYVNLWQNLRSAMSGSVGSLEGGVYSALSQIGITAGSDGFLSISDTEDFEEALEGNLDEVAALFNSEDGIGVRLESLLEQYSSASGIIYSSKEAINTKVENLDDRIDRYRVLMDMEEEGLIEQYSKLQQAIADQQNMLSILNSITSGLY